MSMAVKVKNGKILKHLHRVSSPSFVSGDRPKKSTDSNTQKLRPKL